MNDAFATNGKPCNDAAKRSTFEQYMQAIDFWCNRLAGLSVYDLSDYCFRDAYDDGVKASTVARRAIKASRDE